MAMSARSKPVNPTKFSDFIRKASSAEKKRVYVEVMKRASVRQNAILQRLAAVKDKS